MADDTQRRLTTIVAADIASYSRLVRTDEEGTLAALRDHRDELIDNLIDQHSGRIANTAGDSILMEFPSTVDAVRCAIAMQQGMMSRNHDIASERRIAFRIGVNVGDVIAQGDDLMGDGVNIAARLESLSEPGGIALSSNAYEYIEGKVEARFTDGGEHTVKNISRPLRVWQWSPVVSTSAKPVPVKSPMTPRDKPSIAVLPFDNKSRDTEQEYFADGITDEIVGGLARFGDLFVISRQSTSAFKGKAMSIPEVAQQLAVKFIMEGTVQRMGNRLRISVRLLNGADGGLLLSERYDREMDDYFVLQDEISERVIGIIAPTMAQVSRDLARRKAPSDMAAWDYLLRGEWHILRHTHEDVALGRNLVEQAIAMDPTSAAAHARLAFSYFMDAWGIKTWPDWQGDEEIALSRAVETARHALTFEDDYLAYGTLCCCSYHRHDYDTALFAGRRSIELNPNYALGHAAYSLALTYCGRMEEALPIADKSIDLSPYDPIRWSCRCARGLALYQLGRYDEAAAESRLAVSDQNDYLDGWIVQCAALGQLERQIEAQQALKTIYDIKPEFSQATVDWTFPIRDSQLRDHLAEGLQKAGFTT